MSTFALLPVHSSQLADVSRLEAESYPADEAATPEGLAARAAEAPQFFRVLTVDGAVAGFICGTATDSAALTHDSMGSHTPGGATLCIHSVVVQEGLRRRGLASWALRRYLLDVLAAVPAVRRVRLIAKAAVRPLYANAGFHDRGLSQVVHGADPWYEMGIDVTERHRCLETAQTDAFAEQPFAGNPAAFVFFPAVMTVAEAAHFGDSPAMLAMAAENNLSETAFVRPVEDGTYQLRWFTPTTEVSLCGHATLAASALMLYTLRLVPKCQDTLRFRSKSGLLYAHRRPEGRVALQFPDEAPSAVPADERATVTARLQEAFPALANDDVLYVGRNRMDVLVEVTHAAFTALGDVQSMAAIRAVPCRGVIVTAATGRPVDDASEPHFVSRFFAPLAGVPEDPVTGSAHCALFPYYEAKLKAGAHTLRARQGVKRGGSLLVRRAPDGRVELLGAAVATKVGHCTAAVTAFLRDDDQRLRGEAAAGAAAGAGGSAE